MKKMNLLRSSLFGILLICLSLNSFSSSFLAAVKAENDKWGYIDETGNWAIEANYDKAKDFIDGIGIVLYKNSYHYINPEGNLLSMPDGYEVKHYFSEGYARVFNPALRKWGFINKSGELVIEGLFDKAEDFKDGMAAVALGKMWGFINTTGQNVIKHDYFMAKSFSEGMALVKTPKGWTFINKAGQELDLESGIICKYDYSDGLARVVKGKKYGYINKSGEMIIEPRFDRASDFQCGFAYAGNGDVLNFINKQGEKIIDDNFDFVKTPKKCIAVARRKGEDKVNYINAQGTFISEGKSYIAKHQFNEGLARVQNYEKYGYINESGEMVIDAKYDNAKNFANGYARVKIGSVWGIIDKSGNQVIECNYALIGDLMPTQPVASSSGGGQQVIFRSQEGPVAAPERRKE